MPDIFTFVRRRHKDSENAIRTETRSGRVGKWGAGARKNKQPTDDKKDRSEKDTVSVGIITPFSNERSIKNGAIT